MTKTITLLQTTLALGLTFGLTACETVSDAASGAGDTVSSAASALDPTGWFGGDDSAPPPDASTDVASNDTEARTSPDLANLPARPATSTPAQQQAAAQSLAADGAQARYSADSLRAGTEPSAAPPPAADVPPSARVAAAAPPPPPANDAPPSASDAPPSAGDAPPSASDAPPTTDAPPSARPAVAAVAPPPAAAAPAPPTAVAAAAPPPALAQGTAAVPTGAPPTRTAAPVQTAALAPTRAPGAEPAVPAVPPNTPVRGAAMSNQPLSDAALGFKPSAAPPLDPSINKWVSAPVVARYRQTASNAVASAPLAAVPPKGLPAMSGGAVVANLDAVSAGPAGIATNGGVAPTATVYFPGDGTTLSVAGRNQIKTAVARYKAMGAGGAIRVVGHSSSRTANMPVEKHLEVIFEKSQQRANAVAQELIHQGIPADRVLIEAVGDSQPVYFESMPRGEEGNRRTEIFLQG